MSVTIQFYPLDIHYVTRDNKTYALVMGRAVDGKTACLVDNSIKPYFYIIPKPDVDEYDLAKLLINLKIKEKDKVFTILDTLVEKKRLGEKEVTAIKVMTNLAGAPRLFARELKRRPEIGDIYEHDIPFTRQYLLQSGITPCTLYEVKGEEVNFRSRADIVIRPLSYTQVSTDIIERPRILSIDIETYSPLGTSSPPEEYPILMISFSSDNFKRLITWKRFKTDLDYIEFVNSEADLIQRFKETLLEFNPDFIVGYFSDGFDMPYICTRADKYRIDLDVGMDYSSMKVHRGVTSHARIVGMTHIDLFGFVKFIMKGALHTDSFDLDSVAQELLNQKKKDVNIEKLPEVWDNNPQELERFCEYNMFDSILTHKLCLNMLPNIMELVKVVGLTPFRTIRMPVSQLVEWYLSSQAYSYSMIIPCKPDREEIARRQKQTFRGGFVLEPQPGFYGQIAVFDFRSLYPTIIASHNISPGTINQNVPQEQRDYAPVEGKKYWFDKDKKGFMPKAIAELISRRARVTEMLKTKEDSQLEARSRILKIIANSFYGYFTFYLSRWYSLECAESVTAWGRKYIFEVIDEAQDMGFIVLYSDTDSVFLSLRGKEQEDALKFAERVNSQLPELMELELENFYPAGLFVSAKQTGYGAKKKYALLCEDGTIKIKGFETVRSNWSLFAKQLQEKVISTILRGGKIEDAAGYVKDDASRLRRNEIPIDDVLVYTQLSKELDEYETIAPHVAVAKRMKGMGLPVGPGTTISYVIVRGEKKIADRARLPDEIKQSYYDGEYYVKHQILPSVEKIFELLDYDIASDIEQKSQSKLNSFI